MVRSLIALFLVLVLSALAPHRLGAQSAPPPPDVMDMSLEELMKVDIDSVSTASGYKQKVNVAPASITIITAEEIQRYGYQTLADILRNVPGFYVTNDRNYSYLGIRGFGRPGDYNSRVLLLVDGHRTNDNIFDQALIGAEFPVDIDLIDRVEVIRGPNSSLYVASAFLAVINVITKTARKQEGLTAAGEVGSYGTYKSRVTYGHQYADGLGVLLSGTYYDSAGPSRLFFPDFNSPATNNGIAQNADSDSSHQIFTSLTYGGFRLEGAWGWRDKQIPTASFGTVFNDPNERTVDSRGYVDLAYDHKFGSDWGFTAKLYYDGYHYGGLYPYSSASGGSTIIQNKDVANGQWWGAQFAVSKTVSERQTIILGAQYEDNFEQAQSNFNVQPYLQYFSSRPTSELGGVYVQDEIHLRPYLTLDVGLRYDDYSTFGGTTNPRVALIYQPFKKTTVKVLYAQSFRPPNAYELYYAGLGEEGNTHLLPERARSMEIAVEQYLAGGVRLVMSGYYYPIRNLISQEIDSVNGNIVYQNALRADLRGVEASLKKQMRSGIESGISLSVQHSNQLGSQTTLTNSPHLLSQANLSVPLFRNKVFASADANYVSRRLTAAGNYAGAYFLPNFTLLSRTFRRWQFSGSIYNAFNEKYSDPASIGDPEDVIVQNGRTFALRVTYHF
jgi:iron complex outermembrane receptor protein